MTWRCTLFLSLFLGCSGRTDSDTGPEIETGWFSDTASPEQCPGVLKDWLPKDGSTQWYWRDRPTFWTGNSRQETYSATLWQGATALDAELVWDASGVSFQLDMGRPFAPNTEYMLEVTDCRETRRVTFMTSDYGTPLEGSAETLVGTTYLIDLAGAEWLEPGGFSALLSLYFTTPILLMVNYADATHVDFLGAQGYRDDLGQFYQLPSEATFDFPLAKWPQQPYFEVVSPKVGITYQNIPIAIYNFSLSGTFAADGSKIGGSKVEGLGDTRFMGPLIGQGDDPNAICTQAAALGVQCTDCPDGEQTCLFLSAVDVNGTRVPGLQLTPK